MIDRELVFGASGYSVDAVQRAIYRFSDRLSCDLESEADLLRCSIHLMSDDAELAEVTLSDFRNEVLDQALRERIRKETELTRNIILSLAFSQTDLITPEDEG